MDGLALQAPHILATGPLLAILFPVTDSLDLPLEPDVYWVQHLLLLLMPLYLSVTSDTFSLQEERLTDLASPALALSIFIIYHLLLLTPLSLLTWANLNSTMCPAQTDPFRGQFYKTIAISHQTLIVPLF